MNNAGAVMFKPNNSTALDLVDASEFDAYLGALSLNVSASGLAGTLSTQASGGTALGTLTGMKTPYSATNLVPAGTGELANSKSPALARGRGFLLSGGWEIEGVAASRSGLIPSGGIKETAERNKW